MPTPDPRPALAAALAVLLEPGQVAELRIPHAGQRRQTVSGYFDDPAKLAAAAAHWDGQADGIYVTLNPVQPALLARRVNRAVVVGRDEPTTDDRAILRRRWLPIDLDFDRPKGISTTDAEHQAALDLAGRIAADLGGLGWPAPVEGDSGNGAHLLYPIDLPNDPSSLELVNRCLQALALRYKQAVVVDTGNGIAARIWKLYGTRAC
jgi:hypothetical protein